MKKLLFGMAFFMGAMMFGGGSEVNAQDTVEPIEGEKWVCCLVIDSGVFCTDFLGGGWSDSVKRPGPFCP